MAIILEFRRPEETSARATPPADGSLGEIIIFPGVRIERRTVSEMPRETDAPARRRARVRKK